MRISSYFGSAILFIIAGCSVSPDDGAAGQKSQDATEPLSMTNVAKQGHTFRVLDYVGWSAKQIEEIRGKPRTVYGVQDMTGWPETPPHLREIDRSRWPSNVQDRKFGRRPLGAIKQAIYYSGRRMERLIVFYDADDVVLFAVSEWSDL